MININRIINISQPSNQVALIGTWGFNDQLETNNVEQCVARWMPALSQSESCFSIFTIFVTLMMSPFENNQDQVRKDGSFLE